MYFYFFRLQIRGNNVNKDYDVKLICRLFRYKIISTINRKKNNFQNNRICRYNTVLLKL